MPPRPPGPTDSPPARRRRGFEPAISLLQSPIRAAGEARGFAVARLLTHWPEIVGEDLARLCRPVRMSYGRDGLGATLTVLVQGAAAPLVEMSRERIREKVNACHGYNAVSRVLLTQTAATDFAEGQAAFAPAPPAPPPAPDPAVSARARGLAGEVRDDGLRGALELLARNVLSRPRN